MNNVRKRVHIISLTFDSNKIIAPLEQLGYDKIYAFNESREEFKTSTWRSLSSLESLRNLVSGSDLLVIECKSELPYIYEKMQQIIKEESGQGSSIFINASSGSRIFTLASALFSGEAHVELYYTHSKSYYVERDFSSGVEKIEILPQVALQAKEIEIDSSLTFILMPFSEKINAVYEDILVPVLSELNLKPLRADEIFDNRSIMDDIWDNIKKSRLVISDLTGKNPNVFYETGIAHALGKEVILITQNLDDVPFDLRHLRCIVYTDNLRGAEKLKSQLTKTVEIILSRKSAR